MSAKTIDQETKFYESLKNIFIGAKIEGVSGYINLMKVKSSYFDKIFKLLNDEINERLSEFPKFKEELFNKLYSFFKRYFSESGSLYFVHSPFSERIYERVYTDKEDVSLFWKTHMLYYVKTDRIFNNMNIEINGSNFFFDATRIEYKKAWEKKEIIYEFKNVEKNGKISFYVLYSEKGRKTKIKDILKKLKENKIKLDEEILERAFRVFEKQSEVDYFINKNAKKFLREQFDLWFYQYEFSDKSEFTERRLKQLKVLQHIAYKIIDFISQFEDELVRVWNKPKFVLDSNYVITLDRILENNGLKLIEKMLKEKNFEKQLDEWKKLGIVDEDFKVNNIFKNNLKGKIIKPKYKYLPIDTKYFKNLELEIISLFNNLDKDLDGWLIKSENYQGLNTILPKFKGKFQTIFIDPPFNKEQDADYFYKVKFKDATWITMLENRLELAKDFLRDTGSIFVRCDYNGNMFVRLLMNEIFGKENFRNEIFINRSKYTKGATNIFLNKVDSLFFFAKSNKSLLSEMLRKKELYRFGKETIKRLYPFLENKIGKEELKEAFNETFWLPFLHLPGQQKNIPYREVFGVKFTPPSGRHWAFSQENLNIAVKEGKVRLKCKKCGYLHYKGKWTVCPKCDNKDAKPQIFNVTDMISTNWTDILSYSQTHLFPTENSEILLKRFIESVTHPNKSDLIMDFFLGIGTTIAVAHKLGKKWVGIEMGEHFNEVYYEFDGNKRIAALIFLLLVLLKIQAQLYTG